MQTLKQLQNGELNGLVSLTLSEGLTHFPEEIFQLAETLEMLDLSRNKLDALPADFGRLQKLKILFCSENLFTVLPEVLADCPLLDIVGFKANMIETVPARAVNPNIRWLILTNNRVNELPAEIGSCHRMQKLMLAGNRLSNLPYELSKCHNLSLLRISANRLNTLPGWLLKMPKLSWLAFSGNPFCINPEVESLTPIHWGDLEISQMLGEGASGVIYKATKRANDQMKEVAIKVFKGSVTSDGLPEDEMKACIAAGAHPGLIPIIGQIAAHPEDKKGLVMDLIPPHFGNLGITPTFESCTRDVYAPGLGFSMEHVLKIARTIAAVGAQLHRNGIMHSDLYAHNILIDDERNTLFGDFGAACFYDKADTELADALERLEVSAFGYLLDDLITLCDDSGGEALTKLIQLRDNCLAPDVFTRPGFQYLEEELQKLLA